MGTPARSDEAAISENAAMIVASLSGRLGEVTRAIQQRLASEAPELRDDTRLLELLGASVEGNLGTVFHTFNIESRSKTSSLRRRRSSMRAGWPSGACR